MNINKFQTEVATGRFTLPVVVLACLVLWGVSTHEWTDLGSLFILVSIGYLMIEANTTFTLIRTRTALPVSIYWVTCSILFFLHPFEWGNLMALAFMAAIFQFFRSYESPTASAPVYNAFLCLGLGSLFFPQAIWFVPLLLVSMIPFRTSGIKNILAALLGLVTPYWFLLGYAFCTNRMPLFLTPIQEMTHISPIGYNQLPTNEIISWFFVTLIHTIFGCHYLQMSYIDRTRTRIFHSFLMYAGWWTMVLCILQPQHLHVLLPVQVICMSFLGGHLFTLTRNRFSGILFVVIFVSIILLCIYNLWMQ